MNNSTRSAARAAGAKQSSIKPTAAKQPNRTQARVPNSGPLAANPSSGTSTLDPSKGPLTRDPSNEPHTLDPELSSKLDEIKSDSSVSAQVLSLLTLLCIRVSDQESTINEQRRKIAQLETENAKTDQYNRRSTIIVSGLPRESHEKPESLKRNICATLSRSGVSVSPDDLQACHRNAQDNSDSNKPPSVTVRFFNYDRKDSVVNGYHNYDKEKKCKREVTVTQSLNYHFRTLKKAINAHVGSANIRYIHYRSASSGLVVQFKKECVTSGDLTLRKIFSFDDFEARLLDAQTIFADSAKHSNATDD